MTEEIIDGEVVERTELVPISRTASALDMPPEEFRAALDRRQANRKVLLDWIRGALVDGIDYGTVQTKRGPSRPTLLKPGAEKICGMMGVTVTFPNILEYEKAAVNGQPIEVLLLRCELHNAQGQLMGEGTGARLVSKDYGDINKSIKMAQKSAQIDATLRMAGLSEIFTQDVEDMHSASSHTQSASTPAQPSPNLQRSADYEAENLKWIRPIWQKAKAAGMEAATFSRLEKDEEINRRAEVPEEKRVAFNASVDSWILDYEAAATSSTPLVDEQEQPCTQDDVIYLFDKARKHNAEIKTWEDFWHLVRPLAGNYDLGKLGCRPLIMPEWNKINTRFLKLWPAMANQDLEV